MDVNNYAWNIFIEICRQYNILMSDDKPIGDQWNFDQENRQPPKAGLDIPNLFQ